MYQRINVQKRKKIVFLFFQTKKSEINTNLNCLCSCFKYSKLINTVKIVFFPKFNF